MSYTFTPVAPEHVAATALMADLLGAAPCTTALVDLRMIRPELVNGGRAPLARAYRDRYTALAKAGRHTPEHVPADVLAEWSATFADAVTRLSAGAARGTR